MFAYLSDTPMCDGWSKESHSVGDWDELSKVFRGSVTLFLCDDCWKDYRPTVMKECSCGRWRWNYIPNCLDCGSEK